MATGVESQELYVNGTNGTPSLAPDATLPIPPSAAPSFDPAQFRTYLLALLPPVLGASVDELEASLFDSEFEERAARFAAEGTEAVYVVKTRRGDLDGECFRLMLTLRVVIYLRFHRRSTSIIRVCAHAAAPVQF
jgi:hypothetical protein